MNSSARSYVCTHEHTRAMKLPVQTCYVAPNRGSVKQICVYGTVQSEFRRDQRIFFKWRELFRIRGNIKKTLAMISRCETSRCDAPTNVLEPDIIKQNKIRIMTYVNVTMSQLDVTTKLREINHRMIAILLFLKSSGL